MDDAFFINRDAQCVASELQRGDAAGAANLLREDCQHMDPREFSSLLRHTKGDQDAISSHTGSAPLAGITLYRDGEVRVTSQDKQQYAAGQLPPMEIADLMAPPPRPFEGQPGPWGPPPEPYRGQPAWGPPPESVYIQPPNNTAVDTIGGALIGGIIGGNGHGRNGALNGALIGGAAGAILGTAQDNANR
jgi:hypothetical protein